MTLKKQKEKEVVIAARDFGISSVLFRNAIADKLDLNVTDLECLRLLFFKGGISTPTELARYTGLTTGSTTAMLDRLEEAGLIRRKPNPQDRRGVLIEINRKSRRRLEPMFAGVRKLQDELVSGYSLTELKTLAGYLNRFTAILEESRKSII